MKFHNVNYGVLRTSEALSRGVNAPHIALNIRAIKMKNNYVTCPLSPFQFANCNGILCPLFLPVVFFFAACRFRFVLPFPSPDFLSHSIIRLFLRLPFSHSSSSRVSPFLSYLVPVFFSCNDFTHYFLSPRVSFFARLRNLYSDFSRFTRATISLLEWEIDETIFRAINAASF